MKIYAVWPRKGYIKVADKMVVGKMVGVVKRIKTVFKEAIHFEVWR